MRYLSCFSGIGGLEASTPPELFCEADEAAAGVLRYLHPEIEIFPDVRRLKPPRVDVVAGGWPCQDLSVAGRQAGLSGLRSSLLLDMLRVAQDAGAHTVVAENVTNLLRMRNGREFNASLNGIHDSGYRFIAWRVLNTREFGLPQHRSRLLIVASKDETVANSLFRPIPDQDKRATRASASTEAAGFYWTAGIHSINYSRGYVPTIKIGSSVGIPSPPAVHFGSTVRALTPEEALRLQGFDIPLSEFPRASDAYRAAGNAVSRRIGRWVMDGLGEPTDVQKVHAVPSSMFADDDSAPQFPPAGISDDGELCKVHVEVNATATNLIDFLDTSNRERLSARASRGLLERLSRSGQPCPADLRAILEGLAA